MSQHVRRAVLARLCVLTVDLDQDDLTSNATAEDIEGDRAGRADALSRASAEGRKHGEPSDPGVFTPWMSSVRPRRAHRRTVSQTSGVSRTAA